jgi:hypothetical protein
VGGPDKTPDPIATEDEDDGDEDAGHPHQTGLSHQPRNAFAAMMLSAPSYPAWTRGALYVWRDVACSEGGR